MMRLFMLTCLLVAATAPATADVVTIPLPELSGDYQAIPEIPPGSGDISRLTTLTLPAEVTAIDQLRLVVSGSWVEGLQWCSGDQGPEPGPFNAWLSMFLTIPGAPGDFYYAGVMPPNGSFSDLSGTFQTCCPPGALTLDQLLGTTLEIEFFVDAAVLGLCSVENDTYGTVTDVHLEITGTVPTEGSTWSRVKALYR